MIRALAFWSQEQVAAQQPLGPVILATAVLSPLQAPPHTAGVTDTDPTPLQPLSTLDRLLYVFIRGGHWASQPLPDAPEQCSCISESPGEL